MQGFMDDNPCFKSNILKFIRQWFPFLLAGNRGGRWRKGCGNTSSSFLKGVLYSTKSGIIRPRPFAPPLHWIHLDQDLNLTFLSGGSDGDLQIHGLFPKVIRSSLEDRVPPTRYCVL